MGSEGMKEAWEEAAEALFAIWNEAQGIRYKGPPWTPGPAAWDRLSEPERRRYETKLDMLRKREEASRLKPELDGEDDDNEALSTYLHNATALALWLSIRDGYSEDVRDALGRAWGAALRIFGEERYDPDDWKVWYSKDQFSFATNAATATALLLQALVRLHRVDGKYREALHEFALCLNHANGVPQSMLAAEDAEWLEGLNVHFAVLDFDLQDAADLFEKLRSSREPDWRGVAEDCQEIAESFPGPAWVMKTSATRKDFEGREYFVVTNATGREFEWDTYWFQAAGYALARLEPSELRDELRRREEELIDNFLSTFFFQPSVSSCLPQRARERLIVAAEQWLRGDRGVASIIPNELRIVVEELLYHAVWAPLDRWANFVRPSLSADFVDLRSELQRKREQPDLVDFKKVLETSACKEFLSTNTAYRTERDFLLKVLPGILDELRQTRRQPEHIYSRTLERVEVMELFNKLLGVNQSGVLPRLSKLYVDVMKSEAKKPKG